MNDYDCIVALLLDFQSDKHFQNVGGNTALHIAAARNSKESAKWLLLRGTDPSIKNKSNKTAQEVAHTASSAEVEAVIKKFTPDQISIIDLIQFHHLLQRLQ